MPPYILVFWFIFHHGIPSWYLSFVSVAAGPRSVCQISGFLVEFLRCLPFFFFSSTHPLHTHKPAVQLQDKYLSKASQMSHASVVWHLTRKLAQQIKDVKCRRHQKKSQSAIAATSVVLSSLTEIASAVMVWVAVLRPTAMVCALISGRTMAQTVVREKVRSNQVFFFNDRTQVFFF